MGWEFHEDAGVREKLGGEIPAPKTIGDYYRSFSEENLNGLGDFLRSQARRYRKQISAKAPLIIDIDSTSHVQRKCIEASISAGAKFTITARGRSNWLDKVLAGGVTNWESWKFTDEEIKDAADAGVPLPTIEVGSMVYKPGWSENLRFEVIVKRTLVKDKKTGQDVWKHYGVITNWNTFRNKYQTIIEFHNRREDAENLIKEQKWSYDLLHFPMLKLSANQAYGLLFTVAHNFLRVLSLLENRNHPMYAKKFRRKFISIAGRLVWKSGQRVMRMPEPKESEVSQMMKRWRETFQTLLASAG